jgi:hypothetical protein
VIHEFKARTLEFARVSGEPFTYISREEYRELPKCVETSEGKICCGLGERALAYYELHEEKWTEYPEFEGDEAEEDIHHVGVCYKTQSHCQSALVRSNCCCKPKYLVVVAH